MKRVAKGFVSFLLIAVLMLMCFVLPTSAIDLAKDTFIIDGNIYYDISNDLNGNGWSWDVSEFKLTLDGYNSSYIVFVPATKCSKTLKIIIKNNNSIFYNKDETPCPVDSTKNCATSSYKCYFCAKCQSIAALFVNNCTVNISGGVLNVKALGKSADAISLTGDSIIENTTLNCTATGTSISASVIKAKKSIINLDSERAFSANINVEECKISYKNSDINNTYHETIDSGGDHVFKNSTFEITLGARPLDNNSIYFSGFQGVARYEFDNTVVKIKQGPHNNPENSSVLFSLGYPDVENNKITIKNNSKFEIDECIDYVFSANEVNISDSTVTGVCGKKLVGAIKFNVTNSKIDVVAKGENTDVYIEAHEINVKNSDLKFKTNGYLWVPNKWFDFPNEKKISLTDSSVEFNGKVDEFGEKWSLNYTIPEKWIVTLDGKRSDSSVNSSKLDLRHETIVIKINENYTPPQNNTTTDKNENVSSETVTSDSPTISDVQASDLSSTQPTDQSTVSQPSDTSTGKEQPPAKSNGGMIVIIVVLSVLVLAGAGVVVFFIIKKKAVK